MKSLHFTRIFASLIDLKNEQIKFYPITFKYGDVSDTEDIKVIEVIGTESNLNDEVVLERLSQFTRNMDDSGDGRTSAVSIEESATSPG